MKLILSENGKVVFNYDYYGDNQPDIVFVKNIFYIRFGEYLYRAANAYIDKKYLINEKGEQVIINKTI
jgi:hypothetical protein